MDTDTDTYGMIKRVRQLQKQIIAKSAVVESKDQAIQSSEKLYVNLRKVLARQPGSEAAEQLRLYAATLRDKKSKFKQIKNELKTYKFRLLQLCLFCLFGFLTWQLISLFCFRYQSKVYEYKYELQNLSQDMQLLKMDYFAARRREQQASRRPAYSAGVSQHEYPEDDEFFPPPGGDDVEKTKAIEFEEKQPENPAEQQGDDGRIEPL
jgi:hypothetical protein